MSPRARTRPEARLERVELIVGDVEGRRAAFARDVAHGLGPGPRSLPTRWMLDAGGVELLRKLRKAPTSYGLDAERQLLRDRAYALPLYFPVQAPTVIEVGVVDAVRTQQVLAPLVESFGTLRYTAVGPDRSAVDEPCRALADAFPGVRVTAMVGRPEDALRDLRVTAAPVLLLWPDSGLAEMSRADGVAYLRGVGAALRPRDLLVATFDLRKDPRLVLRVYRDRHGIAKQLHLNLLQRMNDDLGAHFDVSLFRHRFDYVEETGELASEIVSRRAQSVRIDALGLDVALNRGEAIATHTATKHSPQEIDQLAHAALLNVHERWYDREGRVCANLLRCQG